MACIAVLGVWTQAAAAAEASSPTLGFTANEYFLPDRAFVWLPGHPWHDDGRGTTRTEMYFDKVVVRRTGDGAEDVRFTVEGLPDKGEYQLCHSRRGSDCGDAKIGVREDSGLLFVEVDRAIDFATVRNVNQYSVRQSMYDGRRQRVELAAEETTSALKVYREVVVSPPRGAPDCGDYPDLDEERYACLYTREQLTDTPLPAPSELTEGLPDVVQPAANYRLIFREEFDGVPTQRPAESCLNGMVTLDSDAWNYDGDPCEFVDGNGVPCVNVSGGQFRMGISSTCLSKRDYFLHTGGKFAYRYGYLETKYTVNFDAHRPWHNASFVLGDAKRPFIRLLGRYGMTLDSYEDLLTQIQTEVDIFEYLPPYAADVAHQYLNWSPKVHDQNVEPRRTNKWITYCGFTSRTEGIRVSPSTGCNRGGDEVTVTRGVEWTPEGYRTFIKVDGLHDDLTLYPKDRITMQRLKWHASTGEYQDASGGLTAITYQGAARDQFFGEGEDGTYLEQLGVAHLPMGLWVKFFGSGDLEASRYSSIKTTMRIDYIRVFQPEDRYVDMEPVYQ